MMIMITMTKAMMTIYQSRVSTDYTMPVDWILKSSKETCHCLQLCFADYNRRLIADPPPPQAESLTRQAYRISEAWLKRNPIRILLRNNWLTYGWIETSGTHKEYRVKSAAEPTYRQTDRKSKILVKAKATKTLHTMHYTQRDRCVRYRVHARIGYTCLFRLYIHMFLLIQGF